MTERRGRDHAIRNSKTAAAAPIAPDQTNSPAAITRSAPDGFVAIAYPAGSRKKLRYRHGSPGRAPLRQQRSTARHTGSSKSSVANLISPLVRLNSA
ncbi:hypothetical protein [Stakelama flava]|uniref:hypothetical protein n=1 Tax=Stakelama flava TaxID=2860338 RepID=UPI001C5A651D|nr:hypothetical protein [Stakelama flava]